MSNIISLRKSKREKRKKVKKISERSTHPKKADNGRTSRRRIKIP